MGSSAESLSDRRGDLGDISERQSMGFITSGILGESPHLSRPECLNVKWATGMSSVPGPAHMPVVRRSRGTLGADPGVLGSLSSLKQLRALGRVPDPEASDLSSGRAAVSTRIAGPRGSLSTGSSRVNTQGCQLVPEGPSLQSSVCSTVSQQLWEAGEELTKTRALVLGKRV